MWYKHEELAWAACKVTKGGREVELENGATAARCVSVATSKAKWQLEPLLATMDFEYNRKLGAVAKIINVGEDASFDTTLFEEGGYDVVLNEFDEAEEPEE